MDSSVTHNGQLLVSSIRNKISSIASLVEELKKYPPQDAPVKHHFSKGVYVREIFMPEDMLIVGKIHKTRHLNIISKGRCKVVTPTRTLEISAPYTFESAEGEQKVVYMYEDTIWSTVHVTEETDLAKIEEDCIATDYDDTLINKLINSIGDNL